VWHRSSSPRAMRPVGEALDLAINVGLGDRLAQEDVPRVEDDTRLDVTRLVSIGKSQHLVRQSLPPVGGLPFDGRACAPAEHGCSADRPGRG
jgi:hypothetical protein